MKTEHPDNSVPVDVSPAGRPEADPVAAAATVLRRGLKHYHPAVALAASFSLEDVVLVDLLMDIRPDARIFALDTGRLPPETYACAEAVRRRYGLRIEWYFPRHEAVEPLVREHGLFSFRETVEAREECCFIRKVEPLQRALQGLRAWITGQRREQAVTRAGLAVLETDAAHGGIAKLNPLADWTLAQVWAYVRARRLPYNRLYDRGYASIGCAPCTRAVAPGADQRAGRWWWESPAHKECGLHAGGRPPAA